MCIKIWDKKVKVCDSFVFLKCIVVVKDRLFVWMYVYEKCMFGLFFYICMKNFLLKFNNYK